MSTAIIYCYLLDENDVIIVGHWDCNIIDPGVNSGISS